MATNSNCPCPSPHPGECPWVRVESEDELRAGMTVEVRPCLWCKGSNRYVLLAANGRAIGLSPHGDYIAGLEFRVAPRACGLATDHDSTGFPTAIREGRLYRLRDLPPEQAEETSAPVKREKERTR